MMLNNTCLSIVCVCVFACVCGRGITGHQQVMITGAYSALEFFLKKLDIVYIQYLYSLSLSYRLNAV